MEHSGQYYCRLLFRVSHDKQNLPKTEIFLSNLFAPDPAITNNFCTYILVFASLLNDEIFRFRKARRRNLCVINEHLESELNTAAATTQIVFQRPVKFYIKVCCPHLRYRFLLPNLNA